MRSFAPYRNLFKPMLDRVAALALLVALAPILVLVGLAVSFFLRGRILFVQTRIGKLGREFRLIKFRTMTEAVDNSGNLLPDDQRLTPFGQWLRRTSLDELPELWNILRGEMSLVGPRPLLVEYLPRYTRQQARRHEVLPGLTGLAQVFGRNLLSWEEKFAADVEYVDNVSLWLDLRIVWRTIGLTLSCQGVSANAHATMPYFTGEERENAA